MWKFPDVTWDDVGGTGELKARLREAVEWPLNYAAFYEQAKVAPSKGILLSGPPGCGKTLLAKALAHESGVNFISVKGPVLLSKYVGESERGVREVFRKARQAAPCIVFFDEIEALLPTRSAGVSDSHVSERVLSQFLVELDGVEELKGVLVLGATNRPDLIDPAALRPGRFDALIAIPLPDQEGRKEIFGIHLRGKPVEDGINVEELAVDADRFTGAEIAAVCRNAALEAIRRAVEAVSSNSAAEPVLLIKFSDLRAAVEEVRRRDLAT